MNSQEVFEEIKDLFEQFVDGHNAPTKAGKGRARKATRRAKEISN
jgi:hypothetical protein